MEAECVGGGRISAHTLPPLPSRSGPSNYAHLCNRTRDLLGYGSTDLVLPDLRARHRRDNGAVVSSRLPEPKTNESGFDEVLAAAKAGEEWAWHTIYDSLAGPVSGYLRSRGAQDAEDLTSEVFLQVARDVGTFEGPEHKFRSWVFVIAHRRMQDERRARMRRPLTTDEPIPELDDETGDVEYEVLTELAAARVAEILRTLTDDQRQVITLRLIGDLSLQETAEVMGKRVGAVKALQRRALAALKAAIESGSVSI